MTKLKRFLIGVLLFLVFGFTACGPTPEPEVMIGPEVAPALPSPIAGDACTWTGKPICQARIAYACAQWFYLNQNGLKIELHPEGKVWIVNGACT